MTHAGVHGCTQPSLAQACGHMSLFGFSAEGDFSIFRFKAVKAPKAPNGPKGPKPIDFYGVRNYTPESGLLLEAR